MLEDGKDMLFIVVFLDFVECKIFYGCVVVCVMIDG